MTEDKKDSDDTCAAPSVPKMWTVWLDELMHSHLLSKLNRSEWTETALWPRRTSARSPPETEPKVCTEQPGRRVGASGEPAGLGQMWPRPSAPACAPMVRVGS